MWLLVHPSALTHTQNTHTNVHTYAIDGMGKKSFLKFVELYLMNL